jgi:acyl carrier protein
MNLADIEKLVCLQLGLTHVGADSHLIEDLGAESMDLVHLAIAIEDRFDVFVPEEDLGRIVTVRDVFDLVQRLLAHQ